MGWKLGKGPFILTVFALTVPKPRETAGSQASLSWVGRRPGSSQETSSRDLPPTPSLAPSGRSHSDLPAVGGVLRAPGFQTMPPRHPGPLLGLARGQQQQQKHRTPNNKAPGPNNSPSHIRGALSLLASCLCRARMSGYSPQLHPMVKANALSGDLGFPNSALLLGHPPWVV